MDHCQTQKTPFVLLVRKRTFETYKGKSMPRKDEFSLTREAVLETVSQIAPSGSVFVGTTGYTSRELYEIRTKYHQSHATDFYTVGCMGHATSIGMDLCFYHEFLF